MLDRFTTLTGWAEALVAEGAAVVVVQRFHRAAALERSGVAYQFVPDTAPAAPAWTFSSREIERTVAAASPSVVHINSMDYPRLIRGIRRIGGDRVAIAVQDHGGFDPRDLSAIRKAWLRHGLAAANVLLTATPAQAADFRASGVLRGGTAIRDVMEGSTDLRVGDRAPRRPGALRVLWVGRLNANKDPLTVFDGFARFAATSPATLSFVYNGGDLEPDLRAAIDRIPAAGSHVTLTGAVVHSALTAHYAAADVFVLGSRREGSGFAALEAMACGVVPVLTDIPSFRGLTDDGRIGALWECGNAASLAAALERVSASSLDEQRTAAQRFFEAQFSWPAIGRRAMTIYREVSER